MTPVQTSYVLPLKWSEPRPLDEPTRYLTWLQERAEVIVVDGSPGPVFDSHARRWARLVTHLRPDPMFRFANGKVNGVATGMQLASHEAVVIADDDVRYDAVALERVAALLQEHDLVRPQNYFDPMPWHAAWDTARILLNRAFGSDFPGTLGVRRSAFEATGGYDGNVLFENLELIRTIAARGGRQIAPADLFVRRMPPDAAHFLGQRVRQAYDDFALPARMALWLSVVPAAAACLWKGSARPLAAAAGASIAVAESGRRRGGGDAVFPARASLFAPLWLLERGVCSWAALAGKVTKGGVAYADGVIERAATPKRELQRRFA